jgi:hypothetical protein
LIGVCPPLEWVVGATTRTLASSRFGGVCPVLLILNRGCRLLSGWASFPRACGALWDRMVTAVAAVAIGRCPSHSDTSGTRWVQQSGQNRRDGAEKTSRAKHRLVGQVGPLGGCLDTKVCLVERGGD